MFFKISVNQIVLRNHPRGYRVTSICKSNSNIGQRRVLRVSTTRGVPSTSTNLKEALCEKIPVHYDLLRNFRREHGQSVISRITVDDMYDGLRGVNTMVRETSENDPKYGVRYRGLTIPEILNLLPRHGTSPSVEAVFWLLLTGDVPTREQTASLINDWASRRQRRKEWWSGGNGGIVGSVLQNLPDNVTPLGRLSIALTALDAGKHTKKAVKDGALNHTYWEHTYEDSMELLAALPAIVGLVGKGQELRNITEKGDWVDFLIECLSNTSEDLKDKTSVGDFLRLYVALNADEDCGVPGVHITQIAGDSYLDINQALASGVLVYENEPVTGTMSKYMEFQENVKNVLGTEPKEETLKDYLTSFIERDEVIGHKEAQFGDPRYEALLNHVKTHLPGDTEVKLSQEITRVLTILMKTTKDKYIFPEQSSIAAPMFKFYGLKDMKFNQVLLCMSRVLGAVASIIWTRAINAPSYVNKLCTKCQVQQRGVQRPKHSYTMAETERIEIPENTINTNEVNTHEIRPAPGLLMTHSVNSTPSGLTTNTRMFNFGARAAEHSRILANNLSFSFEEIRPLIEHAHTSPRISLSSLLNLQRIQSQARTVSPATDSYIINLDDELTSDANIRNQSAHDHHNHQTTTTDNFLNNIREAANEVAAETHNNNNNADEITQNALQRSPETRELLRVLQRYVPYILILLTKSIYDNRAGILNFIVLLTTFVYANNDLKHEIAKQHNRSWTSLLSILFFIVGCFLFVNVLFEIHVFIAQPLTFSELLCSVVVTDFVLKLITIIFKVILTCLPVRLLAFHKRGKYYVMVEVTSQLCRCIAPIQPWVYYLSETYQGPERVVGIALSAAYTISKGNDLLSCITLFFKTLLKLVHNMSLGVSPSTEQLLDSGGICAICHEEYNMPVKLDCQHIFCEVCVWTWLTRGKSCPLCRAPITDDAVYHDGHTTLFIQLY
ncbi:hypothetical protein KPH14_012380 [Odynerus spinipes]|uniref:RING-type domain-containing protein n=1 Tax=Odynerus spinipes TaxID=1348599 RepID=A0AAD9RI11_9HYME|nr:hypothetical protein KPH14_012380 [Odynerus spinipes]